MIDQAVLRHMTRNEADMAFKRRVQTIFEWIEPRDEAVILDCACGRGSRCGWRREGGQRPE